MLNWWLFIATVLIWIAAYVWYAAASFVSFQKFWQRQFARLSRSR
jgi:hypothetical protein